MKPLYFLGIALGLATAVAACTTTTSTDQLNNGLGADDEGSENGAIDTGEEGTEKPKETTGSKDTPATSPDDNIPPGPVATNSTGGKALYISSVHTFLGPKCGSCHGAAGPGPNWLTTGDAEKSYAQLFSQGYVVPNSRITAKPAHGGLTTNALSNAEVQKYNDWVALETKDGGTKATPNVLAMLGTCFDRQKFDAMKLQDWRTTRRTNNNNTNNVTPWNENANNCTGCDNAPCTTCHSADPATNFVNAVGNPIFGPDHTFTESKSTSPAYIAKYFGVSPDGKAVGSNGIKKKSEATKKDKAYTHPMFQLNGAQQTALDAFVDDVVTRYNAGTCGK